MKRIKTLLLATLIAIALFTNLPLTVNAAEPKGDAPVTEWRFTNGFWYYYKDGIAQTGWLLEGNTWYYLKPNGAMATGWLLLGNTWYFLNPNGAMLTGWLQQGNTWYYLKSDGSMAANETLKINGTSYRFTSSGAMESNSAKDGKTIAFPYQFKAKDLFGNSVSNETLGDKEVYFVHLWATWCGPCVKEMPAIAGLVQKYGDRVGFLALLTDYDSNIKGAKKIIQDAGIPDSFIVINANLSSVRDIADLLDSGAVPTTVLISRNGNSNQIVGAYGKGYSSFINKYLK